MDQLMVRPKNKAHAATLRRIAERYGGMPANGEGPDIRTTSLTIEVETTATIKDGIRRLQNVEGLVYVAVTNKEAISEALRLASETRVGVMDPQGNVLRESSLD